MTSGLRSGGEREATQEVPHAVKNADKKANLIKENKVDESQFALQSSTFSESEAMSTVEACISYGHSARGIGRKESD